jgi:AcrR family transcriptional regulator
MRRQRKSAVRKTAAKKADVAILDSAERLFAIEGVNAVSLRQVAIDAKVDAASITYHFGNKESLVEAVIARRVAAMNEARLKALADALTRTRNQPSVEDVLHAMYRPWLDYHTSGDPGWRYYSMLVARMTLTPSLAEIFHRHMGEVERHFNNAFLLALPTIDEVHLNWGMMLTLGCGIFIFSETPRIDLVSEGLVSAKDIDAGYRQFIEYAAFGLRRLAENPNRKT